VLRNEIGDELQLIGTENFKYLDGLNPGKFDSLTYVETLAFFESLKKFYNNRYTKADKHKDGKINRSTNTPEKERKFEKERNSYQNEAITELVKNSDEFNRIIEKDGKLVQKFIRFTKTRPRAYG